MPSPDTTSPARFLCLVAGEATEEPDTIQRHPEVVDVLLRLAGSASLPAIFERVIPGVVADPAGYVRSLAELVAVYRNEPLDDAPEVVEGLALVAWIVEAATSLESVNQFAAVALAS